MANIRSSGHQIKKRLLEYMDTERYLDSQIERLRTLESKMYSIGSPEITDMPKGSNVIKDRIGTMVAKKEEIGARVRQEEGFRRKKRVVHTAMHEDTQQSHAEHHRHRSKERFVMKQY